LDFEATLGIFLHVTQGLKIAKKNFCILVLRSYSLCKIAWTICSFTVRIPAPIDISPMLLRPLGIFSIEEILVQSLVLRKLDTMSEIRAFLHWIGLYIGYGSQSDVIAKKETFLWLYLINRFNTWRQMEGERGILTG
jgi:hypothetical protein